MYTETKVPYRYEKTGRFAVEDESSTNLIVGFRDTTLSRDDIVLKEYVVKEGDTLQDLALRFYQTPELWSVLADANVQFFYPGDISDHAGETLYVPTKRTARIR